MDARDALTVAELDAENRRYCGTPGVSEIARRHGFRPAFLDRATGVVYPSRYADGRLSPFHVFDGLPPALVVTRERDGRAIGVRESVVSGFVRDGRFYTRTEAAEAAGDEDE